MEDFERPDHWRAGLRVCVAVVLAMVLAARVIWAIFGLEPL